MTALRTDTCSELFSEPNVTQELPFGRHLQIIVAVVPVKDIHLSKIVPFGQRPVKDSRRLRQRTGTKTRPERKPERGGKQVRTGKAVQAPVHHLPVTAWQTAAIRTKNRPADFRPKGNCHIRSNGS